MTIFLMIYSDEFSKFCARKSVEGRKSQRFFFGFVLRISGLLTFIAICYGLSITAIILMFKFYTTVNIFSKSLVFFHLNFFSYFLKLLWHFFLNSIKKEIRKIIRLKDQKSTNYTEVSSFRVAHVIYRNFLYPSMLFFVSWHQYSLFLDGSRSICHVLVYFSHHLLLSIRCILHGRH